MFTRKKSMKNALIYSSYNQAMVFTDKIIGKYVREFHDTIILPLSFLGSTIFSFRFDQARSGSNWFYLVQKFWFHRFKSPIKYILLVTDI